MLYFIASISLVSAGYGVASSVQPFSTQDSRLSQGSWVQPMKMQTYTPKVSSFSQGSNIAVQGSWGQQSYTPKVSSFSQGSNIAIQPMQMKAQPMKIQTYTPKVPSFSQGSNIAVQGSWGQQAYTPKVSSFSQGSNIAIQPMQMKAQPMKMQTYTPKVSSFSQVSNIAVQGSWVQQAYMPKVSSFSQGSNIAIQPMQMKAQPMKMQTYTPTVSSFSQGSNIAVQGSWGQQAYTPTVSSFSQGSNIAIQPMQMKAYRAPYTSMAPKMSSFSQGARVSAPLVSNPYQIRSLKNMPSQVVVSRQKTAGVPVQNQYIGEEHVIHNDLKVHENHQTDKTILTKKIVHHAPVLHKTIRTHEIAEDTVHDKLVHHLNTVEDQWKRVPGQSYVGNQKAVDHTKPVAPAPKFEAPTIPKTVRVAPHNA